MAQGLNTISKEKVIDFLLATNFFHGFTIPLLEQLVEKFEPVWLLGGDVLMHQGDEGDSLYLVCNGRLRVVREENGKASCLGELGRGEIIGELALLTQEARIATVTAIRDSLVLKLSKADFDDFAKRYPMQLLSIVKHSILRIVHQTQQTVNTISTIAVAPAGNNKEEFQAFSAKLASELIAHAPTLHLTSQKVDALLSQSEIAQTGLNDARNGEITSWLNDQENKYRYLIYEVDAEYTSWTQRCLRQADRVILVGDAKSDPELNHIEQALFEKNKKIHKMIDLVLIQNDNNMPKKTNAWLQSRVLESHHHILRNNSTDIARVIRYITGKSVGLVFAGGGARGLVHIGVYKALLELGIPVDLVGGTSAGALVSCLIAMNIPIETMIELIKSNITSNKQLFDYTAPLISVLSARSWTRMLRNVFGEEPHLEDLWRRCFVISSNITKREINVHQTGLIWKAVRASISLPGIVPPVSTEEGDILIDGGIINNLPVDVMRKFGNGGKVMAVNLNQRHPIQGDINPQGWLSGWSLLGQRINPFKKVPLDIPNIAEIIYESIVLCSIRHTRLMMNEADYTLEIDPSEFKLFDFTSIDSLVKIGYEMTMKALSKS